VNLVIENSVFTENIAPHKGAVLSLGVNGADGNLHLNNIKVFNNNHHDTITHHLPAVFASVHGNFNIERLHAYGVGEDEYIIYGAATDSLLVSSMIIENFNNRYGDIVRLATMNYMSMNNILFRDNSVLHGYGYLVTLIGGTDESLIEIQNFLLTDNSSRGIWIDADTLYADSLIFLRNQNGDDYVCGRISVDAIGEIHNLVVQDNVGGAFGYQPEGFSPIILSTSCSIYDGLFENNTILLHNDPEDPDDSCGGGTVLGYAGQNPPTVLENCRFVNNFHDDPDDYNNPEVAPVGTQGRVLDIQFNNFDGTILRHCLFQNNRQPNIAPDKPWYGTGSHGVGSLLYADGGGFTSEGSSFVLEDVVIQDNDDGAIMIEYVDEVSMHNVQIIDTPRRGLEIYDAENVMLENVHISGVVEQENYFSYPWEWCDHAALYLRSNQSAIVRNMTITDCDLPFLFALGTGSTSLPEFHNVIIAGNNYQYLRRPLANGNPVYAEYSYIQEAVEGLNNIVGNDPLFHTELGVPYLDEFSPCVDTGNPDPVYDDSEDPDNTGWPLWPSQGTLRNDIGFTGGPHAMVQEFEAIPNAGAAPRGCPPQTIQLSQNYPNPFNPTTTIEFSLPYPQDIQLTVYNIVGQQEAMLAVGHKPAGAHQVTFNGSGLSSGIYIYRLTARDHVLTRKMVLVR